MIAHRTCLVVVPATWVVFVSCQLLASTNGIDDTSANPETATITAPETLELPTSPTSSISRVSPALLTVPSFSDYAIIISRKPFGTPPPTPDKPVAPVIDNSAVKQAQEEQKLAKQINMVAVNKTPAGRTAVGFIDKSEKPERNYYINVGDTVNGYTVVEASYEDETATLSKDDITITLKLGQGLVKGGDAPPASAAGHGGTGRSRVTVTDLPSPPSRPTVLPSPATSVARTFNSESFRERLFRQRAEREAAEKARREQQTLDAQGLAEKITKEELEKGKREINLNLIRQGMKPISPIVLTPEEDAEMVQLGVLQEQ